MTRIINLRQARKHRARNASRAAGDTNAAKFGEAKPLRDLRKAEKDRALCDHDSHRIDRTDETGPDG